MRPSSSEAKRGRNAGFNYGEAMVAPGIRKDVGPQAQGAKMNLTCGQTKRTALLIAPYSKSQPLESLTFTESFLQSNLTAVISGASLIKSSFMPWFLYETIRPHGQITESFEFKQLTEDQPISRHPQTGEPVRRLYSRPLCTMQSGHALNLRNVRSSKSPEN